jgi:hypothetical protein
VGGIGLVGSGAAIANAPIAAGVGSLGVSAIGTATANAPLGVAEALLALTTAIAAATAPVPTAAAHGSTPTTPVTGYGAATARLPIAFAMGSIPNPTPPTPEPTELDEDEMRFPNFAPALPPWSQSMPANAFNSLISTYGVRFQYLRAHSCPCTQSGSTPGAGQPTCHQCYGRGTYYDQPGLPFVGLISFGHGIGSPDEPGFTMQKEVGIANRAEPTLSIPVTGTGYEAQVYASSTEMDAYVEIDAASRQSAVLVAGVQEVIPYQQGIIVQDVTVFDANTHRTAILSRQEYTVTGAKVVLNKPYPNGTPYTVEYTALPVYVAFRHAGGAAHIRPFGLGQGGIPKRFRAVNLDLWTRATQQDNTGPQSPFYLSEKIPPAAAANIPSYALPLVGWA